MTEQAKFNVEHKEINNIDCLYLKGHLDAHTAPELEQVLSSLVTNNRNKILVNLQELEYISSAGLGVFMAFIEDVRDKGGDIKLTSMKPKVYSVFDLLGFPLLFDIEDDQEKAIQKFLEGKRKEVSF